MTAPSHVLARMQWRGSAHHLALVRVMVGVYLTTVFSSPAIPLLRSLPVAIYPGTHTFVPLALELWLSEHAVTPLLGVGLVASALVAVGLFTRAALAVALVSTLVTQHYYYRVLTAHDDWMYFVFFLLVLLCSRCADRWSLDAILFRRELSVDDRDYRWPVELMGAWLALLYVAAGIAKLFPLRKGLVWLKGHAMQGMVMNEIHESAIYWLLGRSLFDYGLTWPFVALSVGGAAVELSAGLVLLSNRAKPYVFAAIVGFHASVYLFGITGFLTIFLFASLTWANPRWFERAARPTTR